VSIGGLFFRNQKVVGEKEKSSKKEGLCEALKKKVTRGSLKKS